MIDQKVVVLATGGTIAMKYDPKLKGLVPPARVKTWLRPCRV